MNTIDNSFLLNAEAWLLRSSQAVISHWNDDLKTFIRNTESQHQGFFTSASMHSVIALQNIGLWHNNVTTGNKIITPYFALDTKFSQSAVDMLEAIVTANKNGSDNKWVDFLLQNSSHVSGSNVHNRRTAIVLELVLGAWSSLISHNAASKREFETQTKELVAKGRELLKEYLSGFECNLGETPSPALNLTNCILYIKELDSWEDDSSLENLEAIFDHHINYHMARSGSKIGLSFDPVSLATALSGKVKIKQEFTNDLFFQSCLVVIMDAQHANGCWDDGISITYSSTGDVVQQPSVGVAVAIAEAAIQPSYLLDYDEKIGNILKIVLPGLRRTAEYLQHTFQVIKTSGLLTVSGWSSDRTRKKDFSEAWIVALVNRFFYRLWIAEKAMLRHDSLTKLGIKTFKSSSKKAFKIEEYQEKWKAAVIDPDSITRPTEVVWEKFVRPILNKKLNDEILIKPDKLGVSLIIYGPPGSGKTFFIEKMSEFLDWPLVEINPGHFIKNGLELIESTTRELFDLIDNLNHAIVFFDECDELFRTRDNDASNARSILSFATASMLPKLQKLHDNHNVIFVLGTNYLANMDAAIVRPGRFDEIILFDRPDEHARKHLLDKWNSQFEDQKHEILTNTKKFTFQEVNAYIKDPRGFQSSKSDYENWCKLYGTKEINASRLSPEDILKIREKWEEI